MAFTLGLSYGDAGITLLFAAVQNGPVSFVYAITNVRPVIDLFTYLSDQSILPRFP